MINDSYIRVANEVAQLLAVIPGVKECKVDDWDDSQGFCLFAILKGNWFGGYFIPEGENCDIHGDQKAVRRISTKVRSILRKDSNVSTIFKVVTPVGKYSLLDWKYCSFWGYERGDIQIDLTAVLDCEKVYI